MNGNKTTIATMFTIFYNPFFLNDSIYKAALSLSYLRYADATEPLAPFPDIALLLLLPADLLSGFPHISHWEAK